MIKKFDSILIYYTYIMDIIKYRKYVVETDDYLNSPSSWVRIHKNVPDSLKLYNNSWRFKNHPLVNKGEAYWSTNNTLCLGYQLNHNDTIFQPIFSHSRQRKLDIINSKIPEIVLKREEKRLYLEFLKIKKLPIEIVDKIVQIAYCSQNTNMVNV